MKTSHVVGIAFGVSALTFVLGVALFTRLGPFPFIEPGAPAAGAQ